jgi:hypothetical protein
VSTRTESSVTAHAADAGLGAGGTVASPPGAQQQAATVIPGVQDVTFLPFPDLQYRCSTLQAGLQYRCSTLQAGLQSPEDGTRVIRVVHPESPRPAVSRVVALP